MSEQRQSRPALWLSAVVAVAILGGLVAYRFGGQSGRGAGPVPRTPKRREVVAFVADSLALAFGRLEKQFEAVNPELVLIFEPSGSVLAGRKVSSGRRCDLLAVADHRVIDDLMPEYASWRVDFATNEVVIAGTQMSRFVNEIDGSNWHEVLLRDGVTFGRADPRDDPCGYWTLLCWKLADRHYASGSEPPGIYDRLLAKAQPGTGYVREDAHKLLSLVETTGGIDYAFVYRSQAVDHGLRVVELPPEVNLGDPAKESLYRSVSVEVARPDGTTKTIAGKAIVYGLTILKQCRDRDAAERVVRYLLGSEGREILKKSGLPPISPGRLVPSGAAEAPDFGDLVQEAAEK
jgi:molybdate/tungstate transport system substrate-binding protein